MCRVGYRVTAGQTFSHLRFDVSVSSDVKQVEGGVDVPDGRGEKGEEEAEV